ncbi:MAG: hypothetical protein ACI8RZ_004695 [Myxococcota bacterium]|jgi:hypothetical protein
MDHLTAAETMLPSEIQPALQSALWASIGALCLSAVGPFTCYMTYFIALPVGAWGAWKGWQVSQVTPAESDDRALSQIALIGGLMSTLISAFFAFIMVSVLAVYAAIFVFAIVAASSGF